MIRIACQTITWGPEKNRRETAKVMGEVKAAGYAGIEIGARHLEPERTGDYGRMLQEKGLALVALHVGGNFLDRTSVGEQIANIDRIVGMASRLGAEFLFVSGAYKENKTKEDYRFEADTYNKIGMICQNRGLTLCYHNHDWEMAKDLAGWKALCAYTRKELVSFVPDVGWMTRAGYDPVPLIQALGDRMAAVHFKEFTADHRFTELGAGVVDFPRIYEVFKGREEFWVVTEQDTTEKTPLESARINREYLSKLSGEAI
ncbi:MAG: sugar phosphate isomerase/epimerase family protein [Bacillota bacterium]